MINFSETTFANKCGILSEIWVLEEPRLQDYYEEWEISFGIAYAHANNYAQPTPTGEDLINDLWEYTLGLSGVVDTGFESLEEFDNSIKLSKEQEDELIEKSEQEFQDYFLAGLRGETP
jgi:hypothetical protein